MPAGEESLSDLLAGIDRNVIEQNTFVSKIKKVSSNSKDMCQKYLYSWEKSNELLETASYINKNFTDLYNELDNK